MYVPIAKKFGKTLLSSPPVKSSLTYMGPNGENLRDAPQLLNPSFALAIRNYLIATEGQLEKRSGLEMLFEEAGSTTPITLLDQFTEDFIIYGYGTNTKAYQISTGTKILIKNNWPTSSPYSGARYGDYYFVCNGSDVIHRISQTLAYDAQGANFTVGQTITGATSGATAAILQDADAGATGTLTLGNISGVFQDNEIITDPLGGTATVNGTLTLTITAVSAAPKAKVLKVVASRLMAGNLSTDPTAVAYSAVDVATSPPTNPPFTNWTIGVLANEAGQVNYRNAGGVNSIETLGDNICVFSDFGFWAFFINTTAVGANVNKIDVFVQSRLNRGGARGTLTCAKGTFFVNSAGLWQLVSIGQPNIPFSDQDGLNTILLGTKYFQDIDDSNCSIVYDDIRNTIFTTLAKDSEVNNLVIAYNVEKKALSGIDNWNINRFMSFRTKIYGAGANQTKVWECFKGDTDDGNPIPTEYLQELKTGELETRQEMLGQYIHGFLSLDSQVYVRFDIYDSNGFLIEDKVKLLWTAQHGNGMAGGYGSPSWGRPSWGGSENPNDLIESFDGARRKISNYQRIRIHITSNDNLPHSITWVKILTRTKIQTRRRHMQPVT